MRLEQLKGFLAVAETANFRRAAVLLNSTQPTLSARIRNLEEQLGHRLFDRAAGGVRLTQAGHDFRPYAATAVEAMERAQSQLSVPRGWSGIVSVGLHSYLVPSHGLALLSALRTEFANRLVRIETGYSSDIIAQVEGGLVDVGLVFVPRLTTELSVDRLGDQEIRLFASHGLTHDDQDFHQKYVSVHWGEDFRAHEAGLLPGLGVARRSVASPELAMQALLQGPSAAFLDPRHTANSDRSGIVRDVTLAPGYRRAIYSVHLARHLSEAHGRIAKVIRQICDNAAPDLNA